MNLSRREMGKKPSEVKSSYIVETPFSFISYAIFYFKKIELTIEKKIIYFSLLNLKKERKIYIFFFLFKKQYSIRENSLSG